MNKLCYIFFHIQGGKCQYELCKACCKTHCYTENLDCVGHKIWVKSNRRKASSASPAVATVMQQSKLEPINSVSSAEVDALKGTTDSKNISLSSHGANSFVTQSSVTDHSINESSVTSNVHRTLTQQSSCDPT